jgi:antirestriction protein ArdC
LKKKGRKGSAGSDERRAKVAALKEQLAAWQAQAPDPMVAMAIARYAGYSARNAMLIAMQCPHATDVAGFWAWKDRGRKVRKGEHGIQILAPAGRYTEGGERIPEGGDSVGEGDGDKGRQFFRVAYVFDISQTDALEDLPPSPPEEGTWDENEDGEMVRVDLEADDPEPAPATGPAGAYAQLDLFGAS